jgi:hypothetical protein
MRYDRSCLAGLIILAHCALVASVQAEVNHYQKSPLRKITYVEGEDWQPQGFENGISIPAAFVKNPNILIDGKDDDAAWANAQEIPLSLSLGTVDKAWIKALCTDEEVYIRVRWPDSTESREHRPWIWSADKQEYVTGPQVEDSLFLSFESGCEWTPSLLGGYQYDFDGWHWMAARSDPQGQAVDTLGTVTDRVRHGFDKFQSRVLSDDWQMKFVDVSQDNLHAKWDQLERVYMLTPVTKTLYIAATPDGGSMDLQFAEELPPPDAAPSPGDEAKTYPRYRPVKLTGDAGEISAKGHWENGFWTVEFHRALKTVLGGVWDMDFERLTQFSIHVLDQEEGFDKVSESKRLFLEFVAEDRPLVAGQ